MKQQHQFSSIYTGKEFFLTDHQVMGEQVLPGVAYLEMARAAGSYVAQLPITQLKEVNWLQPVKVNQEPVELHVSIQSRADDFTYEIYTGDTEKTLHGQGILSTFLQQEPEAKNISELRNSFTQSEAKADVQDGAGFYEIFHSLGLDYGKTFQGIQQIYYSAEAALSRIALPAADGFLWSPGMMDSALQTCMAISLLDGTQQLMLPFSVREIDIYRPLPEEIWCYVRKNRAGKLASSYDLELLNKAGEVLISFTELVVLPLALKNNTDSAIGLHLYSHNWQAEAINSKESGSTKAVNIVPLVFLAGGAAVLAEKLEERLECEVRMISESLPEAVFTQVLAELQQRKLSKLAVYFVYAVTDELDYSFISGMLKTAVQENPLFTGKMIGVESLAINELDKLTELLLAEQGNPAAEVRYQNGQREVKVLNPFSGSAGSTIKENGVYLITGGAGGLGLIFAAYLNEVAGTKVILAGRSTLGAAKQNTLKELPHTVYERCDVTQLAEVKALIEKIKSQYGRLDGIIHSAGLTRDSLLMNKTAPEAQEVFSAKVNGAKNLDEATKQEQLDFMVYCSSLAGVFGNTGQSDYAAANAWLDNYAHYREQERSQGKRTGKSLSINWPLWKEGGMQIDAAQEKYMASHFGLLPMPAAEGLAAFECLLSSAVAQGVVLYGHPDKLMTLLASPSVTQRTVTAAEKIIAVTDEVLYAASLTYLRGLLTGELRMKEGKLDAETPFEQYGIDSIMITKLTNGLEAVFERIPRTLFFECQTLVELTDYFVEFYPEKLIQLTGVKASYSELSPVCAEVVDELDKVEVAVVKAKGPVKTSATKAANSSANEPVAIIGLGGRYPGAQTIADFWENLKAGKDSITEIPADRWDLTDFYDEEKGKAGKSYSKWGGFLENMDHFDPLFFNISIREAELMDPQARLFLQTAWETLEDAGYTKAKLQGEKGKNPLGAQVGVYVGVMYEEYPLFGAEESAKGNFVNPGGSISSIANRVSYFFNLHGPSMAVDTMCSSSLTAIHLACESIQNGSCTMALAGGVNLSVHPNKYLMLSQGMFVSGQGRCESFGEGGEGYVPGEGVGAVLLKSLSQALADGDRIYGLIRGTSLNHGGKSNGYTVPNPKAQAAVIKAAMKKAGVKAEDFSYIEAHGTGTSLGDPIEIAGLTKAFDSKNKQFCSIGSVKSNIGHCESAAGISGLTKVLLQLKHRQLVPSLHAAKLNPNIDFENTPFKVQQELGEWPALNNKPRIAGISGFGAGGSNAHLIIEEYVPLETASYTAVIPPVIVLSARDTERLRELAANLKSYVKAHPELNLDDLAYTLQTGREAMEERLAFIAEDKEGLIALLTDYQNQKVQELYVGNTHKDHPGISLEGKSGKAYLESAIREKESHSLAQLWAKGVNIDWNLLYTELKPSLIGLPVYPFSSERYWFPQVEGELSVKGSSKLHPLLHSNTSSLQEQQFTSIYTGKEPFLVDHQVQQVKILPGVTYLELARAAAEQSVQEKITQLKDVTWFSPIRVEKVPQTVFTSLFPAAADQEIEYEIYTNNGTQELLHCKGILSTKELDSPEKQDLEKIRTALVQEISGEACYKLFSEAGLEYGSSFRGIKALYYSEYAVLSRISLPVGETCLLSPGVLDSALQTCIGMQLGKSSQEILLPFSVTEFNMYRALPGELWCYAKKNRAGDRVSSYDVDLLNAEGQVLVSFKELVLLPLNGFAKLETAVAAETGDPLKTHFHQVAADSKTIQKPVLQNVNGLHLFANNWKPEAHPFVSSTAVTPLIILAGGSENMAAGLQENLSLVVKATNPINEEDFFNEILAVAKVVMPHKNPAQLMVVCSLDNYGQYGFITGLLKTLTQENSKITGKLISVEDGIFQNIEELTSIIAAEQQTLSQEIRYQAGAREVRVMESLLTKTSDKAVVKIKKGGVYLITGGAGGLGLIFAKYISQTKGAKLILTGRSESLSPAQRSAVGLLGNATYYNCDVSDGAAVNELIKNILAEHSKLDGIIHSAGVVRDSLILHKTAAEVKQVLAAKIKGTRNLDLATKDLALDFMVSCSSIAGVNGNAGQSDYAAANAWVDNYAHYRETERLQGRRKGKTLSINWPLWKDGGMQLDAETETYMELHFGLMPMPTTAGLEAFEDLLNSEIVQGMVLYGQMAGQLGLVDQLIESAESLLDESVRTLDIVPVTVAVTDEVLNDEAVKYLRKLLAKELRMPEEKLLAAVPFENYGIDSVLVIRLSNRLEEVFGKLPRTLFFEYLSLKELCGYFLEAHRSQLIELTGLAADSVTVASAGQQSAIQQSADQQSAGQQENAGRIPFVNQNRRKRFAALSSPEQQQQQQQQQQNLTEAIAIIGISGRYPGANNLPEFWENLKAGKDCITEVPKDRWNAEEMYHQEKGQPGKSYSKWGGFMNDIDKFDPLFFSISPREAELMDPQERLFIQTVWETLEDAGYTRESIRAEDQQTGIARRIGVYAGVMYEEYQLFGAEERMKGNFVTPAGIASSIANRVSYFFNFNGPSMAVDTMCSSSLTAIHLACKDILTGDTDMAIAGGVNVSLHPNKYLMLSQGRFVSGAGRCESFGEGGDGYVPGEGVGAVLLKRLSEAIKDGDHIYGLVKGTALNHGGKTNGYTVPNPKAQAAVIQAAMKKAGVKAGDFSYIEAHGTGTSLGDPIEIAGLNRAFETTVRQFCSIGSVKSNIGHCESAAGISGLTKVILQLQHKQLVPSLHSAALNPDIDFANSPFKVQQQLEEWPAIAGKPRIAGISGFGAGGSNAHLIIEEYQGLPVQSYAYEMPAIIVLSAKQASRIPIQVNKLKSFLEAYPQTNLYNLAYTLQTGREAMDERLAFIAGSIEDLLAQLSSYHQTASYYQGETAHSIAGNIRKGEATARENTTGETAAEETAAKGNEMFTMAKAWVKGVVTDWSSLYEMGLPSRISLPAYPFLKDRYWIPVPNKEISGNVQLNSQINSNEQLQDAVLLELKQHSENTLKTMSSLAYKPVWDRIIELPAASAPILGKQVLVIGNSNPIFAQGLSRWLLNQGAEVSIVEKLGAISDGLAGIYLLQGLPGTVEEQQHELAVLTSIKQLLDAAVKDLKLTVFTCDTQQVFPENTITAAGSGITGLIGALVKEQPQWSVNRIDLELSADPQIPVEPDWSTLFAVSLNKENAVTCLRDNHYYRQHLYPLVLPEIKHSKFRKSGVYVLLGGAGGLGKVTTEYLVKHYQAQVIWLGRRPADATIYAAQEEISVLGRKPEYYQCDANNLADIEKTYQTIKQKYQEIHGLFHTAIVLQDMLLKNMTEADFNKAFLPKSVASRNLVEVFGQQPLDFVCFYSSVQALVHAPGQANYAAGCTYKDSYALSVNSAQLPVKIINWGFWGEVGAVAADGYKDKMKQAGVESINTEEGMRLLEMVISSEQEQVVAIKLSAKAAAAIPVMRRELEISAVKTTSALQLAKPDALVYPKADQLDLTFKTLCCKGLLQVLLELGLAKEQKTGQTLSSLRSALGIDDKYEQLFFVLIGLLREQNYLTVKDSQITIDPAIQPELSDFSFEQQMNALVTQEQEYRPHGALLEVCLVAFQEILSGKQQATSVMFPGGSMEYVSGIYKGNAQADYFNNLLASIVKNSVAASIPYLLPGEKIRILEVGAGTGGTSQVVFKALEPYKEHLFYLYTDLSLSFLSYAEQHFKIIAPYLETAILNIEQDPVNQQIALGSYDIVIGANVVHATKNMTVTLNNIKALLKKNGLFILNEIARTELFTTLTFGLLDGWWLYEDAGVRLKGSPGLSAAGWKTVLTETGYLQVSSYPGIADLSQQIVVALSDGMVHSAITVKQNTIIKNHSPVTQQTLSVMKKAMDNKTLVNKVVNIAAALIKLPPSEFDIESQFMDYGFDSILSMELVKNINETLNVTLKPTDIFSYNNIQELADFLQLNFRENLQTELAAEIAAPEIAAPEIAVSFETSSTSPIQTYFSEPIVVAEPVYLAENDIAVIGMSGQFGAANDLDAFWEVLKNGQSLVGDLPDSRWQGYINKESFKWTGSFLLDIDKFDPVFFKISGNEAELMDPQQRLFLEHCWKAIEDAAINPKSLKGSKCGVYAGVAPSDYSIRESEEASVMWGNSSAVLAARISYLLDLKGPAVSVDTACSSSLLAMDMGCSSLQKGETDLIIAGGVNIMTTPGFYSLADRAGMMSAGGQCYTFDKRADGFVPGEGVGVVIMKRLADAERDGDRIYGVIKASLTNQDGASNGITAPSVLAQQELEKEVYQKFKINPETISYVEAHGTGTSLGDPIELDALTHAFRKYTQRKQYCTIGSVKTNIGHTLVAAGVAGVMKIMLSLKHKQLPPSLNYEECNPLIDMLNSPFKVESKLMDWATENNDPRRAAISSFGFSGTNVHMIIEEYQDHRAIVHATGPAVIVISAKNAERLQHQVKNLEAWLQRNPESLLHEIAYTLQTGRQPMEERLAIIARDRAELNKQLNDFLNGNTDQLMTGNIKKNKADFLLEGGAGQAYIDYAVSHGEIKSIALLWTKGIAISWDLLYEKDKPKRISLPAYAFARQRYWVSEVKAFVNPQHTSYLHPLLHRNTSTVKAIQFTSVFNGREQFLEDHQIQAKKILPGVAYLEMARIAGTEALLQSVTGLKNVAWLSPVSVTNQEEKVHIRLKGSDEEPGYEIYSVAGKERLHSQGRISIAPLPAKDSLDLKAIRSRLSESVERTACYEIFKQMGLDYGASFQGIETMYYSGSEALSKIALPQENGFAVSPGLLDSALQTCMGLSFVDKKSSVQLPFSVKEISFYGEVPNTVWSYARKSKTNHGNGPVTIYDVDIVNEMGDILLSFRDFVTLPVDGPGKTETKESIEDACIFNMNWEESPAEENFAAQEHEMIPLILLAGGPVQLAENLKGELGIETETITGETAEKYLLNVMAVVQKKTTEKHNSHLLIVCSQEDYLEYGFISGLLKTAHLENPGISGKLIVTDRLSVKDMPELMTILQAELNTADSEIRYEKGIRKVKKLQETELSHHDGLKIKTGGVYLILGGAGGVGSIFANHISKTPQTRVILAGRGELDAEKRALIAGLAQGDYFSCDVTHQEEVVRLLALVKEKYQRIDGIIHSAGVTRDSLIINKTQQEVHEVLEAKITGVKNLDEAAKDEALDFMIFFSGLAGISGNAGQADYAAANVYLDNYAFYRENERLKGKRQGKTISINWPFWKEGGMSIDQASLEYLTKQYGLLPLPSASGIHIFDQLLGSGYNQGIVVYGKVDKIRPQFLNKLVVKQKKVNAVAENTPGLHPKVTAKLLTITAQLLKLPESDLELDEKLSDYGFDSILLIKYSNELNDFYDTDLTPAVFYNYPTIDGLAEFLIEEYQEKILVKHQPEPAFMQQEETQEEALQEAVEIRYPLSEGQKGLWFIQQLEPENVNYNVPVSFIIPGTIDHALVKKAFQFTLDEYPILKSSFLTDEHTGEVYNQFNNHAEVELDDQELTEDQDIKAVCWQLIRTPFNLETGRPVKLYIRRDQKAAKNYVLLVFHHIIFDGMSSSVFIASLFEKYQQLLNGQKITLKEPDFAYFNYVEWEQAYMQSKMGERSLAYWKENLSGVLPILNLPYDLYVPGKLKTTTIGIERMQLEQQQVEQLKELSRALKVNLSVIFSGIYAMLLHKLTGEEDLLVLMPTAGRPRKEYENSIGYYVNMMILRNRISGELTFAELVKNIQQEMINGISHAAYPLPKLLADLNLDRSGSRETPFKVSFIYQNIFDEMLKGGSGVEIYEEVYQETAHVYSLEIQDLKKDMIISLKYDQDVFVAGSVKRHMEYFNELLKGVLEDAGKPLKTYEVLSAKEINYLFNERNATAVAYPQNKTLADLFEQQVLQTPDHIAVVHDGQRVTYRELNHKANRLAGLLVKSGLPANAPVAIVSHKSLEQIWGVMGILKAGGHYIPVKGSLPQARMNELISQTESSIVLIQRDYLGKVVCPEGVKIIILEEDTFAGESADHETVKVLDTELAYIIFTSGSTGKPKGVMIDHRGAVNTLYDMNARFNITADDKVFGISDLNFDLSVYDIFGTLACGATLILPLEQEGLNPDIWLRYVQEEKVTVWNSVPQIVNLLIERQEDNAKMQLSSLRMYWMSGDWIPLDLPDRIRKLNPASEVISLGGATEGSIWSIYFPIAEVDPSWKSIPYGYPLGNQAMYVLDANLSPCPVNVPGDIYIGGIGVAKGYHNDPEKTAASFMLHPGSGKPLYRTGDMGCQHPDGFIMFLGRQDGQVKINGFRVELGEIETVMQLSPLVKQGVVLTVEDDCRNKRLVAYVVAHDTLNKEGLQQHLRAHLPEYMVPSIVVEIDKIPLSSNGKVDRKALPDAELSTVAKRDFIAPCDAMEIELAAIWSKLLKTEEVGVHDNFFDAGGNSLTMIQLTHKINTAFGKDIQLIHIMKSPTIAEIKVLINEYEDTQDASVLTLKAGSAEEVTFIIPGALGSTEGYFGLAGSLSGEGAVYGLQMKGIAGNEIPNTSIEAMAAYNLKQIKLTGVIGGVTLLAHSYGGIVIYEMIKQAEDTGVEIEKVILLDCFTDPLSSFYTVQEADKRGTYFRSLIKFSQPWLDEKAVTSLVNQLPAENYMTFICEIVHTLPAKTIARMWEVFHAAISAVYTMEEKLNQTVNFIQADNSKLEGEDWGDAGAAAGWDNYFSDVQIIYSQANHFTIVNAPYCTEWLTKMNIEQNIKQTL